MGMFYATVRLNKQSSEGYSRLRGSCKGFKSQQARNAAVKGSAGGGAEDNRI